MASSLGPLNSQASDSLSTVNDKKEVLTVALVVKACEAGDNAELLRVKFLEKDKVFLGHIIAKRLQQVGLSRRFIVGHNVSFKEGRLTRRPCRLCMSGYHLTKHVKLRFYGWTAEKTVFLRELFTVRQNAKAQARLEKHERQDALRTAAYLSASAARRRQETGGFLQLSGFRF